MAANTTEWFKDPIPVWIKCREIFEDNPFKAVGEVIVQFVVNNQEYTAFVLKKFVNPDIPGLQGFITGKDLGDFLVNMPTETLTSGPNIVVPAAEKDTVLIEVK